MANRPLPDTPAQRPSYQGANPISDVWSARAMEMVASNLVRAIQNPDDDDARGQMMLAAAFAGSGSATPAFICLTACPIRSRAWPEDSSPTATPPITPIVPHGMSVILTAPGRLPVYRPGRSPASSGGRPPAGRRHHWGEGRRTRATLLADRLVDDHARDRDAERAFDAVGIGEEQLDQLVAGTIPQHRVTKLSPRPASDGDLRQPLPGFDDLLVIPTPACEYHSRRGSSNDLRHCFA